MPLSMEDDLGEDASDARKRRLHEKLVLEHYDRQLLVIKFEIVAALFNITAKTDNIYHNPTD